MLLPFVGGCVCECWSRLWVGVSVNVCFICGWIGVVWSNSPVMSVSLLGLSSIVCSQDLMSVQSLQKRHDLLEKDIRSHQVSKGAG